MEKFKIAQGHLDELVGLRFPFLFFILTRGLLFPGQPFQLCYGSDYGVESLFF